MQPTKKIWFDGQFVPWDEAKVHVLTHALHYGYAIFEGIRCNSTPKGPAIFRLKEHVRRLSSGTKAYRMQLPYTEDQLIQGCLNLVKENGLQDCYIRPIVFSSYGEMGVNPMKNKVVGAIAAFASLESGLGLCVGCKAFSLGMRLGLVPPAVCEDCARVVRDPA